MKQFPAILVILAFGTIACNQSRGGKNGVTFKSAVQYNDYIVNRQANHMQNVLDLVKVAEKDLDSADKMLDNFSAETVTYIEEIKEMPAYKGDSVLRDNAVSIFNFYKKVFQIEYRRIIQIRKKGNEMTHEDLEEMKDIVGRLKREEKDYDRSFQNAQKNFADKNNIRLKESEMQKEFKKEINQ